MEKKKVDLQIEELEERIAPGFLSVVPPEGPGGGVTNVAVNDAAAEADGQGVGAVAVTEGEGPGPA